jgi:DNA-binding FrmR family transcriptional regulator
MLPSCGTKPIGLNRGINKFGQSELTAARCAPFSLAPGGRLVVTDEQPAEPSVTHTIREKTKLLNRVRRIRGQIEAVERALDQEIGCADVLQLIAGARGAINGLMAEVMEDHVRAHLIDPAHAPDPQRAHAAEELIDVVRSYLR